MNNGSCIIDKTCLKYSIFKICKFLSSYFTPILFQYCLHNDYAIQWCGCFGCTGQFFFSFLNFIFNIFYVLWSFVYLLQFCFYLYYFTYTNDVITIYWLRCQVSYPSNHMSLLIICNFFIYFGACYLTVCTAFILIYYSAISQ